MTASLARPRLRPRQTLQLLRKTALISDNASPEVRKSQAQFTAAFKEQLGAMSDRELRLLDRRLNGRDMRQLRSGLLRAAQDGMVFTGNPAENRALNREISALSAHAETLSGLVRQACEARNLGPFARPASVAPAGAARNWKDRAKLGRQIQSLADDIAGQITVSRGLAPPAFQDAIQAEYEDISAKAPAQAATRVAEDHSPEAERLAVPDIFIKDFFRLDKRFDAGDGARPLPTAQASGLEHAGQRREISDFLLAYCKGNRDQCLRLASLTNQEAFARIWGNFAKTGIISPPPGLKHAGQIFYGTSVAAQCDLTRAANGDIKANMTLDLYVNMIDHADPQGRRDTARPDDRKSAIHCTFNVTVPARPGAPPRLGPIGYESHLAEKSWP